MRMIIRQNMVPRDQYSIAIRIPQVLVSPGFVLGLALLFVNDYFLKQHSPGVISGKLSDFAGLFIVGLLALTVGHGKPRDLVLPCLLFLWWKSPFAGPVIAAWNSVGIYQIGRTIDYTDYVALIMLPLAYRYARTRPARTCRRPFVYIVALFTIIGIMGTSPAMYSISRDVTEQPGTPAAVGAVSSPVQRIEFLNAVQEVARARGLVLDDQVGGSEFRLYRSEEIVLNAQYDRSQKKGYLWIYARDPYRRSVKEQKNVVNSVWLIMEKELIERGFIVAPHDYTAESRSPISRMRLTLISPSKGIPLTSGYNGTGNEDIAQAQRIIDEFFSSHGYVRDFRDFCYPVQGGFSRDSCRKYYAGRPLGAEKATRTTAVIVQGDVEWQGTILTVTFSQKEQDPSVDINSHLRELKDALEKYFGNRLSLSIKDLLSTETESK